MNLQLRQRRVFVTGSSRGIGRGIAAAFLAEKARVVVNGRDRAVLRDLVREWSPNYGAQNLLACSGDLTAAAAVSRALRQIKAAWGGLDVLVLNLGSGRSLPGLPDTSEWMRVLELNLVAAMDTLRLAADLLAEGRQPAVVFVGSIAGLEVLGAPIAYGAAKAGLHHAMKATARELAPRGIRVNMIAPGNIYFPGGTWDTKQQESPTSTQSMLQAHVPLRRFGTVEEVAAAAVFLASPQAAFITGACLSVDGGQTRS